MDTTDAQREALWALLGELDGARDTYAHAEETDDWEGGYHAGLTTARRAVARHLGLG